MPTQLRHPTSTMIPEAVIVCVDCGGLAHLLTTWPDDDPPRPGDVVVYRCSDCGDRWDVVLPEGPSGPTPKAPGAG